MYKTIGCMQWKKKVEEKKDDKCDLVLYAKDKNNKWYLDSGYARHMTWDKRNFISLNENKIGNVTFGNDGACRIRGKGTIILKNGRGKGQYVLFVDGLKHNLLSVSHMCDKGCDVIFRAKDCEIISTSTGKVLSKGVQTENNLYILKEENEECYINKQDESWLWNMILRHLNFDHIIKLSKKKAFRDLQQ